jgi:hypothetical protein
MSRQQGLPHLFVAFFTVVAAQLRAYGAALATRKPVFVTDVSRSPIFDRAGRMRFLLRFASGVLTRRRLPDTGCGHRRVDWPCDAA